MENEVLDFTAQQNFDFFIYRYELSKEEKSGFLSDCQKVLESAHAATAETLKLACRLAKIRRGFEWKYIINPDDGMSFLYTSFEAFSAYAFGFKKTKTSNLLSLAEFVEYDEKRDLLTFKDARYRTMNMSQLIELAPLSESQRACFTSNIPVAEMRLCKKYINESGTFYADKEEAGFDILSSARAWADKKSQQDEERQAREVDEELHRAANAPAEDGAEFFYQGFYVEENSDASELEAEEEENEDESEYRFSSRERAKRFLSEFEAWETVAIGNEFFDEVKRFRFKNGVTLFAATCKMCVSAESEAEKTLLFYFIALRYGARPIKISKLKLAIWLKAHAETPGVTE